MKDKIIPLPNELNDSFFFTEGNIAWTIDDETEFNPQKPFIYEAAYFSHITSIRPWEHSENLITLLLQEWLGLKDHLQSIFEKRDRKTALLPMKKGISLFLEFLHWANEHPVVLSPEINFDKLLIKPVNIKERLAFIMARPDLYHSFMQLVELMTEMEKGYNKALAIKKLK